MDKKIIYVILLFSLNTHVFAEDTRGIYIIYYHSTRIPYNEIYINIRQYRDDYMIKYETWQMKDNQGFEQTNTSGEIIILKEFFEDLYSRFLRIDFREIILQNTNIFGLDGFSIEVSIGTAIHDIVLHLWSPKFNPIQRGTQEINGLLMEVFDLVNLLDYY